MGLPVKRIIKVLDGEIHMKPSYRTATFRTFLFSLLVFFICSANSGICQGWGKNEIWLLPDSSFAVVEVKDGRKIRHCPHHDANGSLDVEQLIYVLGALDNEEWVDQKNRKTAEKHLTNHYDKFIAGVMKKGLHGSVNINRAGLTELVALPRIGPVLAVKIIAYREAHYSFISIEEIKKIDGIGPGTFNAIRYYIRTGGRS